MSDKSVDRILTIFIIYLLGSFIAASFNPLDWWILGRIIFAVFSVIIIVND